MAEKLAFSGISTFDSPKVQRITATLLNYIYLSKQSSAYPYEKYFRYTEEGENGCWIQGNVKRSFCRAQDTIHSNT